MYMVNTRDIGEWLTCYCSPCEEEKKDEGTTRKYKSSWWSCAKMQAGEAVRKGQITSCMKGRKTTQVVLLRYFGS